MKVLFLTKYSEKGASSRYRFYNYQKYLLANDIIPVYKPLFGNSYLKHLYGGNIIMKNIIAVFSIFKRIFFLLYNSKNYDHIVIEAELFPHMNFSMDFFFINKMKSFSLDFDDNISANYLNTSKIDKIPKLMELANFVTVGNHWYISEFRGNLIYVPTVIDLEHYNIYTISQRNSIPAIIWIGSPSTQKYLKLIENVLVKISETHDFVLKIIGGNIKLNSSLKVEYIEWSGLKENAELAKGDIGIMPLEKNYWEMGKCGFKLIQYMASGIPVIASDLPANREIVIEDISGYIVQNDKEWEDKIVKLLTDYTLRKSMGANGRKIIENKYSYQVWGKKYCDILKQFR